MGKIRSYTVGEVNRNDGLGDIAQPVTREEDAIQSLRSRVMAAVQAGVVAGTISEKEAESLKMDVDAISISLLLGLWVGQQIQIDLDDRYFYIRLTSERNVPKEMPGTDPGPLQGASYVERKRHLDELLRQAIHDQNLEEARKLMAALDREAEKRIADGKNDDDDTDVQYADTGVQYNDPTYEVRVEMIEGMIVHYRENYLLPWNDLTAEQREHRIGYLHAILTAAGIPYAVAGEMRPSGIWSSTYQTVKLIVLDQHCDARESAEWLVSLDRPAAADPKQDDFSGQIRTSVVPESGALGNRDTGDADTFFVPREAGEGEVIVEADKN